MEAGLRRRFEDPRRFRAQSPMGGKSGGSRTLCPIGELEGVISLSDIPQVENDARASNTLRSSRTAPEGAMGQKYLACGVRMGMRLWVEEQAVPAKPATQRDYETIGYVISGRAQLDLAGQTLNLEPGDSWVVPKGALHSYSIPQAFTAVEVTSPPAQVHGRDERQMLD